MSKGKGVWSACYLELFTHEKTDAAAAHLIGTWNEPVPKWLPPLANHLIAVSVLRLNLTLLNRLSTNGVFKVPSPQRFLALAWPDFEAVAIQETQVDVGNWLMSSLVEAGFIEEGPYGMRIHDFEVHNKDILRNRKRRKSGEPSSPVQVPGITRPTATATATATEKKEQSSEPVGGAPIQEIVKIWLEVKAQFRTRWISHNPKNLGQISGQVRQRWDSLPELAVWKLALQAAAADEHWAGKKPSDRHPKGWRASLESFTRPIHFDRWVTEARETDWRYADGEDSAWRAWFTRVEDGSLEAQDMPTLHPAHAFAGDWPTDGSLTPAEQARAEQNLRDWWKMSVYDEREMDSK